MKLKGGDGVTISELQDVFQQVCGVYSYDLIIIESIFHDENNRKCNRSAYCLAHDVRGPGV